MKLVLLIAFLIFPSIGRSDDLICRSLFRLDLSKSTLRRTMNSMRPEDDIAITLVFKHNPREFEYAKWEFEFFSVPTIDENTAYQHHQPFSPYDRLRKKLGEKYEFLKHRIYKDGYGELSYRLTKRQLSLFQDTVFDADDVKAYPYEGASKNLGIIRNVRPPGQSE